MDAAQRTNRKPSGKVQTAGPGTGHIDRPHGQGRRNAGVPRSARGVTGDCRPRYPTRKPKEDSRAVAGNQANDSPSVFATLDAQAPMAVQSRASLAGWPCRGLAGRAASKLSGKRNLAGS